MNVCLGSASSSIYQFLWLDKRVCVNTRLTWRGSWITYQIDGMATKRVVITDPSKVASTSRLMARKEAYECIPAIAAHCSRCYKVGEGASVGDGSRVSCRLRMSLSPWTGCALYARGRGGGRDSLNFARLLKIRHAPHSE